MPYISQQDRQKINEYIDDLIIELNTKYANENFYERSGIANYVITRILLNFLKCGHIWSYTKLSNVIATLECSKMEINRRLLSKYEDKKINDSGDLEEFNL
jgi:hypothetical protein